MSLSLVLSDSEVSTVLATGGSVHLRFSAASVLQCAEGACRAEPGHVGGLEMTLGQARWQGDLADCLGRISHGRVQVNGQPWPALPLPAQLTGEVRVEIQFSNGAWIDARCESVLCRLTGPAAFMPSMAC